MKKSRFTWTRVATLVSSALLNLAAGAPAHALVVVGGQEGWEVSFDGNINAFAVFEDGEVRPDTAAAGTGTLTDDQDASRIRTGLLPALFAFNVKTPTTDGLQGRARVGFYPQIQNANTKNQFGAQIDLREAHMTVDGPFGQVLAGRALSLFLGRNILTDMTLFGVGVQGSVNGPGAGGTTLGRIGYGYVYPQFNAQLRYTTPDAGGFKLAVGAYEPSQIGTGCSVAAGDAACAEETDVPRFEGELSYATKFGAAGVEAWVNGLYQDAEFATGGEVTAEGIGGGIQVAYGPFTALASGYAGEALGTTLMLDTDALDPTGEEREHAGFIVQGTFTLEERTKLGLSYGESSADETDAEAAIRAGTLVVPGVTPGAAFLDTQSSWTLGVYHDATKWMKLVGEFSRAENEWFDGADQESDIFTVGTFFIW